MEETNQLYRNGREEGRTDGEGRLALVTGAGGSIAATLIPSLHESGWRVRALSRNSHPSSGDDDWRTGSFLSPETANEVTERVDVVFHLAGLAHVTAPSPTLGSQFGRVNVDGARILARAAVGNGVSRFIHFSTINVYPLPSRGEIDETCPPGPSGPYAISKLESESAVLEACRESGGTTAVVLRSAAVYGPHLKGNYLRLVQSICRGTFLPIGSGSNLRTLVHERDLARAAMIAATHPAAAWKTYNVTDGQAHSVAAITRTIAEALGLKPPRVQIPVGLARTGLALVAWPSRLLGRDSPIAGDLLDKYLEHVQVSGQAIQRELGFRPAVALREGWADAIEGLRKRGEIPVRCGRIRGTRP